MQNINRSDSADLVDLDFFLENYSEQLVKMTVSPETLTSLSDGVIFLQEKGFLVSANLAYGIDWSNSQNYDTFADELNKLAEYYLANPDVPVCRIIDLPVSRIRPNVEVVPKYCGAGTHMFSYSTDGVCYPCHFFMPLSVGEESAKIFENAKFPKELTKDKLDEKCRDCAIITHCPMCLGANYCESGDLYQKNDNLCKLTKIQFLATSFLQYNKYKNGMLELTPEEELMLLKGIESVQESIV
jgi:radical SAM protein with 4Fe4S-binding SPASM domain